MNFCLRTVNSGIEILICCPHFSFLKSQYFDISSSLLSIPLRLLSIGVLNSTPFLGSEASLVGIKFLSISSTLAIFFSLLPILTHSNSKPYFTPFLVAYPCIKLFLVLYGLILRQFLHICLLVSVVINFEIGYLPSQISHFIFSLLNQDLCFLKKV